MTAPASDMIDAEVSVQAAARWRPWLLGLTLVVAAVVVGASMASHLGRFVSTDDAFVEAPIVYASSQVAGRVAEVLVEEHQRVEKGEPLVRLDPSEYELQLARADASLALVRNRVLQAEAASASANAEGKAATVELWRAKRELERVRLLRERGTVSQADLDTAKAAADAAQARVQALELRAEAEHALINDDAQVRLAEAERKAAALDVERTVIRAPYAGIVGRRNVEVGAVIAPGQPLLALVSSENTWVMANFKETQLKRIRIGAPVDVTIDAFPGFVWEGRVDSFSPATGAEYALIAPEPAAGNFTKVVQRVPVKIALSEPPTKGDSGENRPALAVGLSANVSVHVR